MLHRMEEKRASEQERERERERNAISFSALAAHRCDLEAADIELDDDYRRGAILAEP